MLTAGNVSDVKAAPALLERAGRMRYLLADKGYDADRLRRSLRDAGAVPVITGRRNRKRVIRYDKERYRGRHLIENAFCRLKDFPPCRHSLRQTRHQLPLRRRHRHRLGILAVIESRP